MVAMPQREARYIAEEEYRALELISNVKHEYFNGEIFAMSGGTNAHALIAVNVSSTLRAKLRGKSCRPTSSDQMVKVEATGLNTYPDVSVYCKGARFEGKGDQALLTPVVLIVVLSPSTSNYDRGTKFEHYKQIPSLRDYLLVSSESRSVDHFHRLENGDWLLHSATGLEESIVLESIEVALELSEIYEDVDVPAGPLPLRPREEASPSVEA